MATALRPRGPRGGLLSGNLAAFRRDPLDFLQALARDHGDIVSLRFGPTRVLFINHPDLIEEVLVTRASAFGRARVATRMMRPAAGDGLFTSDGEHWRRQRRLIQPTFGRAQIAAYGATMVALCERLLMSWQEGADGETRDVQQEMMRLTLAIAAKTLFDADVADAATGIGAVVTVGLEETNARLNSLLEPFLPYALPTPRHLRLRRAIRQLDDIVYAIIRQRRAGGAHPQDLLSLLLQARDEGGAMTDRQLRDELVTFLVAGHETTALALTWTWYLLARHPEAEARLWAELSSVLGGRAPAVDDLPALSYTAQVLHEALRLYPPAWVMSRDARRQAVVGGHPVRRGTPVLMSQWTMQRDPRYFDAPDEFRPERWTEAFGRQLPRFAYFPFGGGQRQCIGNNFALQEAMLVLATVAQRFRLALAPAQEVLPSPSLTLRPRGGMPMALYRRT